MWECTYMDRSTVGVPEVGPIIRCYVLNSQEQLILSLSLSSEPLETVNGHETQACKLSKKR